MTFTGNFGSVGKKDHLNGANISISSEHHQIHNGNHYYLSGYETLELNTTTKWTISVPVNGSCHLVFEVVGSDGIQFEFYEGTTGVSGGTAVIPFNNNRRSFNTSALTILKDPTSTNGTLIDSGSSGANNRIGIVSRDREVPLNDNTIYTFLVRSLGNGNIVSHRGEWYELD
jgi:hypothetical protein